jgi:hypothetical protein
MEQFWRDARARGMLDAYSFPLDNVTAEEVLALMKRMQINLCSRELRDIDITVQDE